MTCRQPVRGEKSSQVKILGSENIYRILKVMIPDPRSLQLS